MIVFTTVVAGALIVAQGFAVWGFLRFVKTFGAYAESQHKMASALLYTHESNLLVHQQNLKILDELRKLHTKVEAA